MNFHLKSSETKSSPAKHSKKISKSESSSITTLGIKNEVFIKPPGNLSLKSTHQQLQHLKLSPSKSAMSGYSFNKNSRKSSEYDSVPSTMPTKDIVIRKMKKITKSVQELFKATKESEFRL